MDQMKGLPNKFATMTILHLSLLPARSNSKLHNISLAPKLVKRFINKLHLSKVSGPDCISVVVLKNFEPKLSNVLAELFNMWLEESCFPNCWKVTLVVSAFKNVRERCIIKKYHSVSLLFVVSKVFQKLVNNRLVDHLGKYCLFSDFQYDRRSSLSTADYLKVVFDRTTYFSGYT